MRVMSSTSSRSHLEDLSDLLRTIGDREEGFSVSYGRGDGAIHSGSPHAGEAGSGDGHRERTPGDNERLSLTAGKSAPSAQRICVADSRCGTIRVSVIATTTTECPHWPQYASPGRLHWSPCAGKLARERGGRRAPAGGSCRIGMRRRFCVLPMLGSNSRYPARGSKSITSCGLSASHRVHRARRPS